MVLYCRKPTEDCGKLPPGGWGGGRTGLPGCRKRLGFAFPWPLLSASCQLSPAFQMFIYSLHFQISNSFLIVRVPPSGLWILPSPPWKVFPAGGALLSLCPGSNLLYCRMKKSLHLAFDLV